MRVIVATTMVPFVRGGAEYLADSLCEALQEAGHSVDRFDVPFHSDYKSMLPQMMALRLMDLSGHGDRLIAIRTPSYLIRHHSKVVWFIHHHRPAFDLWDTELRDMPGNARGVALRETFRNADNVALRESAAVFVNSRLMAARVRQHNDLDAELLYPPLRRKHGLFASAYGDYVLCPGRILGHKRQHLFVEALRYTTTAVRLVVAGPCESLDYAERLQVLAEQAGVGDRLLLFTGWLEEDDKRDLFANALAVGYAPLDEDSYGYVSLEAAQSRKAVLTCTDSGGILEIVEDGISGLIAEPRPQDIALCLDTLWNKGVARRMGRALFERMSALRMDWDHVLARLLA